MAALQLNWCSRATSTPPHAGVDGWIGSRSKSGRDLIDTHSFALVTAAVAVGVPLYVNAAVGSAVLGAVTALARLSRR